MLVIVFYLWENEHPVTIASISHIDPKIAQYNETRIRKEQGSANIAKQSNKKKCFTKNGIDLCVCL